MKNKDKKSKMTLDKLASLMKVGFSGVNKRFENTDELIEKLAISTANSFSKIEEKIDDVELRLSSRIESINNRLDHSAENKVGYDKFNPLVKKVDALEKA